VTGGAARSLAVLALLAASGCVNFLDPGDYGTPRYLGEVRGEAPLTMIPPVSDREGNVYVLYGARDENEVKVFVGHAGGGWSDQCGHHRGDEHGIHGWIGRAGKRAWYWSGDALVEVSGLQGSCTEVLERDPSSRTVLLYRGVIPMVKETPSRTYSLAIVQSAGDPRTFIAVVDLDRKRFSSVELFEPAGATDLIVLGTGADPDSDTGFALVSYREGGQVRVEGLFLDLAGRITDRVPVTGAADRGRAAVLGFLHSVDGDVVVGLFEGGDKVVFRRGQGGEVRPAGDNMTPVGVHRWDDRLYLVGTGAGNPAVAAIDRAGRAGSGQLWQASVRAAAALDGDVAVVDDRSEPMRRVAWPSPRTAIGPHPFVSEHSPEAYAIDTTGWLIAGPSFNAGGERITAVAFAPVGVSYP
jgi:hypothetical protein